MTPQKRLLDILLSVTGLLIAAPVMLVIAILVRIDSPGKVIFSQKRLGKNKSYFFIHKFRKFPDDWGTKGSGVTTQGDVRMTSVGAFLERTKLDELPQLWNILKGEMSFVGPRPESTRYEALFTDGYEKLLDFTPGIFGPNQVAFRNESEMYPADEDPDEFYRQHLFPQKADTDIAYFKNASFMEDIGWIFKSLFGTIVGTFNWQRVYNRYSRILLLDFILFQIAWFAAHVFRFNGFNLQFSNKAVFETGCWLIPLIILPIMLLGGCYRHPVRYFSLSDALRLMTTTTAAWCIAIFIQFGFFQRSISIGIALIGLFLFIACLIIPRLIRRKNWLASHPDEQAETRKVLIYGAGQRGSALAKFLDQGFSGLEIVGFLDEDPELRGRHINGLKVFGTWRDREAVLSRFAANELWVSRTSGDIDENEMKNWAVDQGLKFVSMENL